MLKSRLQKLDGLTYDELKKNIEKVLKEIPRENMKIYLRVLMKDQKNMYQKIKQEKIKSSINNFCIV